MSASPISDYDFVDFTEYVKCVGHRSNIKAARQSGTALVGSFSFLVRSKKTFRGWVAFRPVVLQAGIIRGIWGIVVHRLNPHRIHTTGRTPGETGVPLVEGSWVVRLTPSSATTGRLLRARPSRLLCAKSIGSLASFHLAAVQ